MFKQGIKRNGMLAACLLTGVAVTPPALATEALQGKRLSDAMGVAQAFQDSIAVCREQMEKYDIEQTYAANPELLGGIRPGEPEWPAAAALYGDMMKAGCDYDQAVSEDAFARTLQEELSGDDIDALVAFYGSDLGARFREASLTANVAANRATTTKVDDAEVYKAFNEKLQALLASRPAPAESSRVVGSVQALPTADAAVALSDRIMQDVAAGRVAEGFELGFPHVVVTREQLDTFVVQVTKQQDSWDDRFGKSIGYELLRNDTVGDSMIRAVFLHRFDQHAIVWWFLWYRGSQGWVLSRFAFVEDSTTLFR
ncbi:DUF2059 domain-containing protein [Pseudoxanthomonas wuyuanensis]|uniref:DUF2059 domain-containing protein n=1 Tax=Pseudoxanthomonas wuyuanensis TaxID=1073196 RepID=A0A286D2N2_9GAMM|nr:DUF2059 domain-containing protein [Pseudoxanthomonas wuyuanensis]KAF1723097.1 DUF2059 domain-containing protein [Pseudoxanthomonas wuyuanensis]SOD52889.1 hypothetical protein SAMN06296416_102132 [Pseudoxanthomonas wuyuanensis]